MNDPSGTTPAAGLAQPGRLLLDGSARLDSAGGLLEASISLLQWLGVAGKDLRGKPFWPELWKRQPAWEKPLSQWLKSGTPSLTLESAGQSGPISVESVQLPEGRLIFFRTVREATELRSEMLTRLAGGLRHDFNNLMTAIFGLTEGFELHSEEGEPYPEGLTYIRENTAKARQIMERVLDLYEARAGHREYYDAGQQTSAVTDLLKKSLPGRIKLVATPATESLPVLMDRVDFRDALLEMITRLVSLVPESGRLCVELAQSEAAKLPGPVFGVMPAGRVVCITIRLEGLSLPAASLARLLGLDSDQSATQRFVGNHQAAVAMQTAPASTSLLLLLPRADI